MTNGLFYSEMANSHAHTNIDSAKINVEWTRKFTCPNALDVLIKRDEKTKSKKGTEYERITYAFGNNQVQGTSVPIEHATGVARRADGRIFFKCFEHIK